MFTEHTIESAPAAARRSMTATISHNGYLPAAVGLMATSPELLDGFLKMSAAFDGTTLDPIAREAVIMTMATQERLPPVRGDAHRPAHEARRR